MKHRVSDALTEIRWECQWELGHGLEEFLDLGSIIASRPAVGVCVEKKTREWAFCTLLKITTVVKGHCDLDAIHEVKLEFDVVYMNGLRNIIWCPHTNFEHRYAIGNKVRGPPSRNLISQNYLVVEFSVRKHVIPLQAAMNSIINDYDLTLEENGVEVKASMKRKRDEEMEAADGGRGGASGARHDRGRLLRIADSPMSVRSRHRTEQSSNWCVLPSPTAPNWVGATARGPINLHVSFVGDVGEAPAPPVNLGEAPAPSNLDLVRELELDFCKVNENTRLPLQSIDSNIII